MIARFPTTRALKWLDTTHQARLLHRFDQTCNLMNERGEIISLVTQAVGQGPFAVVLDGAVSAEWHTATPITATSATIQIGRITITIDTSSIWNAKPDWSQLQSLNFAALPPPHHDDTAFAQKTADLLQAIITNNPITLLDSAEWLAGRGNGLTPTGDDMLIGVLFALHVWRPDSPLPNRIASIAVPRTTTLSANFLRAAAEGEAVSPWHGLVSAETAAKSAAVEHILATGATSGADAWSGFAQACTMFFQHTFGTT